MSGTHFDLRQRHPACLHLLACSCAHVNIDSCMASICWQPTRLTQCHPHLSCPAGWVAYLGAANAGIPLSIIVKDYGWGAYFTGGCPARNGNLAAWCFCHPHSLRARSQRPKGWTTKHGRLAGGPALGPTSPL